jgi:capsid portal protein
MRAEMEKDMPMDHDKHKQPLEIDIRNILEQLGISKDKWPEEYKKPIGKA